MLETSASIEDFGLWSGFQIRVLFIHANSGRELFFIPIVMVLMVKYSCIEYAALPRPQPLPFSPPFGSVAVSRKLISKQRVTEKSGFRKITNARHNQ